MAGGGVGVVGRGVRVVCVGGLWVCLWVSLGVSLGGLFRVPVVPVTFLLGSLSVRREVDTPRNFANKFSQLKPAAPLSVLTLSPSNDLKFDMMLRKNRC